MSAPTLTRVGLSASARVAFRLPTVATSHARATTTTTVTTLSSKGSHR
jgi:hypothetical protein